MSKSTEDTSQGGFDGDKESKRRVRLGKCFDASPSEILASVSYVSSFWTAFGVGLTSASRSDTQHQWIGDPVPPIPIWGRFCPLDLSSDP